MIALLEKSVNILVVVASWDDISDLLKFWCQAHLGAGLLVSRSMLAFLLLRLEAHPSRPMCLMQNVL